MDRYKVARDDAGRGTENARLADGRVRRPEVEKGRMFLSGRNLLDWQCSVNEKIAETIKIAERVEMRSQTRTHSVSSSPP